MSSSTRRRSGRARPREASGPAPLTWEAADRRAERVSAEREEHMCLCGEMSLKITRRDFLQKSAIAAALAALGNTLVEPSAIRVAEAQADASKGAPKVQTVLGPVSPDAIGVTFMHEHGPVIDWSALYDQPMAPIEGEFRRTAVQQAVRSLEEFHGQLGPWAKTGTIVEVTPIRVGRYPDLIVEMAKKSDVHVV